MRMTRIKLSTFESIRKTDDGLFHALLKATKADPVPPQGTPGKETVVVDSADIKGESFKLAWAKWVERNPELVLSKDSEADTLWQVEQEQAQRDARKAEVDAQSKAAVDRYLTHWVGERKLVNCPTNTEAVLYQAERIQAKEPQIMSKQLLDRAVQAANQAGTLIWTAVEQPVPPPAAPVEPPPPPIILSDGSEQKPLSAIPSSSWTVPQLQDWDRRTREARNAAVRAANNSVAEAFRNASAVSEMTL